MRVVVLWAVDALDRSLFSGKGCGTAGGCEVFGELVLPGETPGSCLPQGQVSFTLGDLRTL